MQTNIRVRLLVPLLGAKSRGAKRWLKVGFCPNQLSPTLGVGTNPDDFFFVLFLRLSSGPSDNHQYFCLKIFLRLYTSMLTHQVTCQRRTEAGRKVAPGSFNIKCNDTTAFCDIGIFVILTFLW